ncbi:hypothetical protein [Burkholderia sp.]|uniref:hypothetical protein n=1 Tax=Burkholderia sp. TaxID=36773 RepID=UPI0025C0D6F8|nr:hypothetical protein [Burkholderia sp.]MBS6361166.1 hypothetical protein [Burkholderia sp.]
MNLLKMLVKISVSLRNPVKFGHAHLLTKSLRIAQTPRSSTDRAGREMADRTLITDADIAREHRLRHLPGPLSEASSNAALRICLANCAAIRKRNTRIDDRPLDGKSLAAGERIDDHGT